ncbi:MAG: aat [Rhizobacter sp.]|nr:aat [Rhizobacter sp.]
MINWIVDSREPLPDTRLALGPDSEAPGLLAAGGELTPKRLVEAYRKGVFPWYSEGQPVLWWSPDPRMVLPVAAFAPSHSLRKTLRRFMRDPQADVRIDTAFRRVIQACAGTPRDGQPGTWIVPEMVEAYVDLHAAGIAHSVETWVDGELVGGLYGIGLGRMFFGESMFSHRTDASKIALSALVAFCRENAVELIDCQQNTSHLASMGAHEVPRSVFESHLSRVSGLPPIASWTYHHSMWANLGLGVGPGAASPHEETGS